MLQYTCRRESYILQTKGCPQWTTLYLLIDYTRLLKPRCNVVASPEIVQSQTQPACCQNNNSHNQLTNDTDRLLQDIQYTPDRADKTYQPNNCSHIKILFKFNNSFSIPNTRLRHTPHHSGTDPALVLQHSIARGRSCAICAQNPQPSSVLCRHPPACLQSLVSYFAGNGQHEL